MSMRKSLAWAYGSQALTLVLNFGSSIVLARLLSPREMGAFAYSLAISSILAIFTSLSLGSYVVREQGQSPETLRPIYTLNMLMSMALSLVVLVAGLIEIYLLGEHDVGAVLLVSSIGPLIGMFEFIPSSLYQREMNYTLLSKIGVFRTVLNACMSMLFAWWEMGALSLVLAGLMGSVFGAVYFSARRWNELVLRPTFVGLKPALVFGLQMMSIGGMAQIAQRVSDIVLGRTLGIASLGLYTRATNLANIVFFNIYGLATGLVFAKLSKDLRETGSMRDTFLLSMRMITAVMWPMMAGIGILSRPLIYWLYGEKWVAAAAPLSLLMVMQFIGLGFGMNWELFVLRRETALQTRYEATRAVVGLAAFCTGALFSITAAAAGRVVEVLVGYFLYRPHIDRLAGTEKGELERMFGESLLLTAVAVAPSLMLMIWSGWAFATSPVEIVLAVGLGGLLWLGAMVVRAHPIIAEVKLVWSKTKVVWSAA